MLESEGQGVELLPASRIALPNEAGSGVPTQMRAAQVRKHGISPSCYEV
jgi:hypothetical protein